MKTIRANPSWSKIAGCGLLAWLALAASAVAADNAWSIEKLVAAQDNWSQLVDVPLRVEGRVASQINGQIRFQKCDLPFHLGDDLIRRVSGAKNVEVYGRLQRDGNRYRFDATDVKTMPNDPQQLQSREATLRNPMAADWYALAEWALQRGRFYDDKELIELGQQGVARGLNLELRQLNGDDVEGRLQLAEKAVTLQAPRTLRDELRYDALRHWLDRAVKSPSPDVEWTKLETQTKAFFPDAFQPLKAWPTDLTRSYNADPQETYRQADENQRPVLERLLGADMQWHRILQSAKEDGSNGADIADRIDRLVPERHTAAEQFRDRELNYRMTQIETAPRAAALELAAAFRNRNRKELAAETLKKWVVAKERRLKPEEAPQFVELADDYFTLVRDEPKAVALLTEAHRREPQSDDVRQRFEQLGYEYDGVRWKKAAAGTPAPKPPDVIPSTIPTRLEIGMTATELNQLLGQPTVTTVMRSAGGIDEIRAYGRRGDGARIVIQLRRTPGQAEATVTRFDSR